MSIVVVSGPPGSGKTTVARRISHEVVVALLSKDTINEALIDVLGTPTVEMSRELSVAAIAVMYAIAGTWERVVVESRWRGSLSASSLTR